MTKNPTGSRALTLAEYAERFAELRTLFDNLPDGVIAVFDADLNVRAANRQVADLLGLPLREVEGSSASTIFGERLPSLAGLLRQVADSGKAIRNYTLEIPDDNGKLKHFLISITGIEEVAATDTGLVLMLHDVSEITRLRDSALKRGHFGRVFGKSPAIRKVYQLIEAVSASPASVLIVGETGTGKELVARTIHRRSDRRRGPFVPVHCTALPETLIESELFGHEKGAFTGATAKRAGRFELAHGGTVFLDEVGTLGLDVQAKLLRVLQERIVESVGSSRGKRIDVRILSATNRDLEELVSQGVFRDDLYFRLKVMRIELPPLRDRRSDIPLLAELFVKRLEKVYEKGVIGLTPSAKEMLLDYAWPGNVRELQNAIEHAFILARGPLLEADFFPAELRYAERAKPLPPPAQDFDEEEEEIREALLATKGNKTEAASLLGIHRSTLWRRMREYRIEKQYGRD